VVVVMRDNHFIPVWAALVFVLAVLAVYVYVIVNATILK
jgi:hypothetical protein